MEDKNGVRNPEEHDDWEAQEGEKADFENYNGSR